MREQLARHSQIGQDARSAGLGVSGENKKNINDLEIGEKSISIMTRTLVILKRSEKIPRGAKGSEANQAQKVGTIRRVCLESGPS